MKSILKALSAVALGLTLVPCLFVFFGKISIQLHYTLMGVGMALWFLTAPFWMKRDV
jgi:ABC-type sulfate transport system permease component